MDNIFKYPDKEVIPILPPVSELIEYLAVLKCPGIYKLRIGWRRALLCPIDSYGEPDLNSPDFSFVQNEFPKIKAIQVNMPCCMLVRNWELIEDAIEPDIASKQWMNIERFGSRDYREPNYDKLAHEMLEMEKIIKKAQDTAG